jgi:hypothetical protein
MSSTRRSGAARRGNGNGDADVAIDAFLSSLGLLGSDARRARDALEAAGLTNARKQRISRAKLEPATAEIDRRFCRVCRVCAEDARGTVLVVEPVHCTRCAGSRNMRAVDDMVEACGAAGVHRLLVVGGSPAMRQDLARLVGTRLDLRLVDGTVRVRKRAADRDVVWADVVVICGSTELDHAVSNVYSRAGGERGTSVVAASRRGLAAIADEVRQHVARRR